MPSQLVMLRLLYYYNRLRIVGQVKGSVSQHFGRKQSVLMGNKECFSLSLHTVKIHHLIMPQ